MEGRQMDIKPHGADSIGEERVEPGIDWEKIRQEMRDYIEQVYGSKNKSRLPYLDNQGNVHFGCCMNNVGSVDNALRWFRVLGEEVQFAIERGLKIPINPDPKWWEEVIVEHEIAHMQQAIRFGIDPRKIAIGFEIEHVDQSDPSGFTYSAFVRLKNHGLTPGQLISLALAPEKPCPATDVPLAITILENNLDLLSQRPHELTQAIILLNTKAGLSFGDIARILIESPPVTQALDELTKSLDELSEILDKLTRGIFDKPAEVWDRLKARISQSRKPGDKK